MGRDSLHNGGNWGLVPVQLERSRRFCNARLSVNRLPRLASSEVLRKMGAS